MPDPSAGYVAELTPYRIQVGDVLDVRLMLNPELNEEVAVRPDGRISTTVVPDELAYNRTVPELAAALRQDYAKDLRNPRLSVVVKSFAPTRIYVGGEVNNPGEMINIGPTLTLSQAIARAGGHKVRGDSDAVFIIRRGPNDVPQYFSVRYSDVIKGRDATADVRLAPFDVVYVPKTGIAEVFDWVNQYFAAIRAGQLGLLLRCGQWWWEHCHSHNVRLNGTLTTGRSGEADVGGSSYAGATPSQFTGVLASASR